MSQQSLVSSVTKSGIYGSISSNFLCHVFQGGVISRTIFGPASRGFISSNIAGSDSAKINGKANSRGNVMANIDSNISFRIQISFRTHLFNIKSF